MPSAYEVEIPVAKPDPVELAPPKVIEPPLVFIVNPLSILMLPTPVPTPEDRRTFPEFVVIEAPIKLE